MAELPNQVNKNIVFEQMGHPVEERPSFLSLAHSDDDDRLSSGIGLWPSSSFSMARPFNKVIAGAERGLSQMQTDATKTYRVTHQVGKNLQLTLI